MSIRRKQEYVKSWGALKAKIVEEELRVSSTTVENNNRC
jgi:hypothetical protein